VVSSKTLYVIAANYSVIGELELPKITPKGTSPSTLSNFIIFVLCLLHYVDFQTLKTINRLYTSWKIIGGILYLILILLIFIILYLYIFIYIFSIKIFIISYYFLLFLIIS
jgi:hypothetical protein